MDDMHNDKVVDLNSRRPRHNEKDTTMALADAVGVTGAEALKMLHDHDAAHNARRDLQIASMIDEILEKNYKGKPIPDDYASGVFDGLLTLAWVLIGKIEEPEIPRITRFKHSLLSQYLSYIGFALVVGCGAFFLSWIYFR